MANLREDMSKTARNSKQEEKNKERAKKMAEKEKERQKKREEIDRRKRIEAEGVEREKRKKGIARSVKVALDKIMKTYSNMDANYIKENDVEILKDGKGNIMGMADGFAFISDNQGTITFYSKPVAGSSYYYYAPMRDDNYQYWFDFNKITAKLGPFKTYSLKPEDVIDKKVDVCDHNYCEPKEEEIQKVLDSLQYTKIEKALSEMRTQSTKR